MRSPVPALLLLLAACATGAARAAENFDGCTDFVTALPATIPTPGTWCLSGNLASSQADGVVLSIGADDVTLDCNGFKLDGGSAGTGTQATGIQAINRHHVTVRHCHVRAFLVGVDFHGDGGLDTTHILV